jgi:hypothetical protein
MVALVRFSPKEGVAVIPPTLTKTGTWLEIAGVIDDIQSDAEEFAEMVRKNPQYFVADTEG